MRLQAPRHQLNVKLICYSGILKSFAISADAESAGFPRVGQPQAVPVANENHAFGVTITYPGFHMWNCYVQGGIETLSYAEDGYAGHPPGVV